MRHLHLVVSSHVANSFKILLLKFSLYIRTVCTVLELTVEMMESFQSSYTHQITNTIKSTY